MSDGGRAGRSILEVAEAVMPLESAQPFFGPSRIDLGDTVTDPDIRALFGPVGRSETVRNFTVRDVVLHAPSMLLFKGGEKLRETRYMVPEAVYDNVRITWGSLVPIAAKAPVIIGFNRDFWGYYHWLVQCLPAIDVGMQQYAGDGAVLALPPLNGWRRDLFDLLGCPETQRIEIKADGCYRISRAAYSEHLNGTTVFGISRTAQQTFQRLRKRARVPPASHEIIYVSRIDAGRRRMRNEDAVIRFLESEGVSIVVPGPLRVVEQIGLFSGARIVIGPHGGGLSNVVFCPEDAALYELLPSHYPNACFNRLAQARGLDYWADMFASDGEGGEHEQSWAVDIEIFKRRFERVRSAARPAAPPSPPSAATLAGAAPANTLQAFFISGKKSRPIHKWHHYFAVYEQYLARFRETAPTVLELGVEQGGGLEMWRHYFGPTCRLFGVDSDAGAKQHEDVADRMFIGDQRDRDFLRAVLREVGRPDVVINDGAHTADQQITAFEEIYPAMTEHGVYLVEDTHTSVWGGEYIDREDRHSFLMYAFIRCAELMCWTGSRESFALLGTGRNVTLWDAAPEFCRMTKEISFFDSMIVFERGRRAVPRHEQR